MTSSKPTLLFVDDEERILRSLEMSFRHTHRVLTTTNGHEALQIMQAETVDVIICDQRMPLITGVEVLRSARDIDPAAMRILLTGYAELASIVGSINDGEIFRYVQKPWQLQELRNTINQAVDIAQTTRSSTPATISRTPTQGHVVVLHNKPAMAQVLGKEKPSLNINNASTLDEALALLELHPNAILLTDLMLAEGDISEGLALLKLRRPQLVVIVVTAFTDTSHLISLINRAQVYRVLPMPLSRRMLLNSLDSALRHQELLNNRPALLRRHQVAPSHTESKTAATIIHRVRSYLDRIRA